MVVAEIALCFVLMAGAGLLARSFVRLLGVVGQVRHDGLDREPRQEVFLPHAQSSMGSMTFVARTEGDAAAQLDPMQEAVWALDPGQTVYRAAKLRELVAKSVVARRFNLRLLGAFAALALTLAAIWLPARRATRLDPTAVLRAE